MLVVVVVVLWYLFFPFSFHSGSSTSNSSSAALTMRAEGRDSASQLRAEAGREVVRLRSGARREPWWWWWSSSWCITPLVVRNLFSWFMVPVFFVCFASLRTSTSLLMTAMRQQPTKTIGSLRSTNSVGLENM